MIELIKVKRVYTSKAGETSALNEVSVTFPDKGLVFITGKSGSGKTTLLNVIGGLDGFDSGEIIIQGKKFSNFTAEEYNSYRNTFVGFVFQGYNLLSEYTIEKNIRLANELQGVESKVEDINALLEQVDLGGLNNRLPSELSGGQKQRVAIARALIKNPKIIIADEPTGALDSNTGVQVLETLKKLSKDRLVIIVSHDLELAEKYADRIISLIDGNIVEDVTLHDAEIQGNVAENGKDFIVKSGSELTEEENQELLKAIKDKKNVLTLENISVRKKEKTKQVKAEKVDKEVKLVSSKMKLKSSVELGLKSLKVKPLRLAFTIFLSVIAFAVFGLFDTIASYSNAKVIANLLNGNDYNSIQISAEHIGTTRTTRLTLPNEEIENIRKQSGYDFRPVYDINDKKYEGINNPTTITSFLPKTSVGKDYYPMALDGFVEFDKDEISADGVIDKHGFNYKIVYGQYPTVKYDKSGDYVNEIAISTLVADAIMHFLAGEPLGDIYINGYQDFIDKEVSITLNSVGYKIVGIIDCGKIPEKYDDLKKYIPNQDPVLASDYKAYISSGCYLMAFVPKGFVDIKRETNNRIPNYYTNEYMYTMLNARNFIISSISALEDTRFYKSTDIPNEKVFLFEKPNDNSSKNTLNDGEVLISLTNFSKMYREEYETLNNDDTYDKEYKKYLAIAGNSDLTIEEREQAVYNLAELFKKANLSIVKDITLRRELKGTGTPTEFKIKLVGVYVDVNTDIGPSTQNWYPLAFNKSMLENIGVYGEQGYYSRVIAPLVRGGAGCSTHDGASFIADSMSKSKGYRLQFYGNSIYDSIDKNGKTITEFTVIALIAAIVLALFSVFMLFNYISASIVSKRQSIGILRALGSKGKDVFIMFMTESLVISLINGIVASGVAYLGCLIVNFYIKNVMNITVDFAIFGVRQIVSIMLASIITGVLSSLLPIVKICKEKPVDLIRKP